MVAHLTTMCQVLGSVILTTPKGSFHRSEIVSMQSKSICKYMYGISFVIILSMESSVVIFFCKFEDFWPLYSFKKHFKCFY